MCEKGKNTNSLMRHIRHQHHIRIEGSGDKKGLLRMGYFHGYKAYRFNKTVSNQFTLQNFQEIQNISQFDDELKSLLYSPMMQLETILKNYTISTIVSNSETDFEEVYKTQLTQYKDIQETYRRQSENGVLSSNGNRKFQKHIKQRLDLKSSFDDSIARNYKENIVQHYLKQSKPLPLWAVFELISFGQFGNFLICLNTESRLKLEDSLGIRDMSMDTNGSMIASHVFILKDLRNAIAHNHIIFDCRFKSTDSNNAIAQQLERRMSIREITFETIVDYLALIIYYQSGLKESKTDMKSLVRKFKNIVIRFQKNTGKNTFDQIMGTNVFGKIDDLENFIATR